jgi:predicted XRE-type DNA-binding protein
MSKLMKDGEFLEQAYELEQYIKDKGMSPAQAFVIFIIAASRIHAVTGKTFSQFTSHIEPSTN